MTSRLSRRVANELALCAVLAPLAVVDMRCPIVTDVFATDASPHGGAVVRAARHVSRDVCKEMWLRAERKGGYTRLEDRSRTMLMQLGIALEF